MQKFQNARKFWSKLQTHKGSVLKYKEEEVALIQHNHVLLFEVKR